MPAERIKAECIKMDNKARAYIVRHVRRTVPYLRDISEVMCVIGREESLGIV